MAHGGKYTQIGDATKMIEKHWQNVEDVGIAHERLTNRIWVCIYGQCRFRAKLTNNGLLIEPYFEDETLAEINLK